MPRLHRLCAVFGLLALAAPLTFAQYKVIDANGRVTYTDRPPVTSNDRIQPLRATGGAAAPASNLPFELRQTAERYPVTLYSGEGCEACLTGRAMLRQRGIPFVEKTVKTDADIAAFRTAESSTELPVLRIGSQQLKGYNDVEWASYLDAAGYPKQSALPPSYRPPEPVPLTEPKAVASQARPAAPAAAPAPATLPPAFERAPEGIRF
ncbi:MAG TPA: glutaredoxin family protein [Methylibium sp.]|uniref:glutaredoxin family protein n=1 Tax=Methylibium sp. TaxID=2067992 RepID=UPI002DB7E93C|nr:glutaredoxin family protein [Methylibium sp.]HEU4459334.1 glutaredoxin family protein [Methylibium sp.]